MKITDVISSQLANIFQKRGELEPPALIKALEREVTRQEKSVDGLNIVPNNYKIFLSEQDYHRLSAARILKALHEAVERKVIRENYFMDGTLTIRLEKMLNGDDLIKIIAAYTDDEAAEETTIDLENDVLSQTLIETVDGDTFNTIVADKEKILASMKTVTPKITSYDLAVITDSETGELILGERQVYLGRKDTNDFVLDDDGASRIHAYISYERHRHVLNDAESLNGTFVNKKKISRHVLKNGDKILIGTTNLIYKVLT
ncbi:MAG: DUF3662 domain-containing protein [Selenomonadaceae bacterium]|nr:DUF3662 domain-containing protein [Selenomonadaceae bacterium]